jgi:glycosyltransferase involved in cell wall biosynthesis
VIEAFAIVAGKYPSWELCLVGACRPESFEGELRDLVRRLDIQDRVEFVPWVPYEEKERLSSQAAIGIITYLPYSNNTSCLPNKLFDYMLVGLPVVASDFPLYREVVEPSQCGLLVDPSQPGEIARAMEYLIQHREEARRMGENGRQAVLDKYNWEKESERLLEIYAAILPNPRQDKGD